MSFKKVFGNFPLFLTPLKVLYGETYKVERCIIICYNFIILMLEICKSTLEVIHHVLRLKLYGFL
jgi:multisubunit Na+/H+ antiporter MnhE subunit